MKKSELTPGDIYKAIAKDTYPWDIIFMEGRVEFISLVNDNAPDSHETYYFNKYLQSEWEAYPNKEFVLASDDEARWLVACREAGRLLPTPAKETYSIY